MTWSCPACGFQNKDGNMVCGGTGSMGCKMPKSGGAGPVRPSKKPNASAPYSASGKQWQCSSCGFRNNSSNTMCGGTGPAGCKAPQGASNPAMMSEMLGGMMGGMMGPMFGGMLGGMPGAPWTCMKCGFANKATNQVCGGAGNLGCKAPNLMGAMMGGKGAEGDAWKCECGFKNRGSNSVCGGEGGTLGCKEKRKAGMRIPVRNSWECGDCGFVNKDTNKICGGTGPKGCNAEKPPDWICECGFINKARNTQCGGTGKAGCDAPRPDDE